jgi:hypothetical protein
VTAAVRKSLAKAAQYEEALMSLEDHPTVKWYRQKVAAPAVAARTTGVDPQWLKELCIEAGAADAGFV